MNAVIKSSLLFLIFILPLIGTYKNFGYEQIKVWFFILSVSLMGLLWMGKGFRWTELNKASGGFISILLVTSLLGSKPLNSIFGTQPYFQGVVLYSYLFLFFLLVSWSKIKFEHWAMVLSGSAFLVGILAIKDWVLLNIFHQLVPNYAGRVVSTFGQPNFFAGFLLLTLPFSYFLFTSDKRVKYWGLAAALISLSGIMVSHSRSAILLALVLLIFGLIDQLKLKRRLVISSLAVLICAIFLSAIFSSGFFWRQFLHPLSINDPDLTKESVENRVYIWPQAFKIGLQKPIAGYGLENISGAFSDYFIKFKHPLFEENLKVSPVLISLKDLNLDRTHNYILDILLFSGVLGLFFWIWLILLLFKRVTQKYDDRRKNVLMISLILYLIWIQFQNQSVVHLIYFWLIAGLIDQGDDS